MVEHACEFCGCDLLDIPQQHADDCQHPDIRSGNTFGRMRNAELERLRSLHIARPRSEWHEDIGAVLWWFFPVTEPPYAGTPNDSDWPLQYSDDIDDPGEGFDLCTHWTPISVPSDPRRAE